jgi:hypothetical protein
VTTPTYVQVQTKTREFGWYTTGAVPSVGHILNYRAEYGCVWDGPFVVTSVEWDIDSPRSAVRVIAKKVGEE